MLNNVELWDTNLPNELLYNGCTSGDIQYIESLTGKKLPTIYKNLMMIQDGGYVKKDTFTYYDNSRMINMNGGVGMMLHVNSLDTSVRSMIITKPEFIPDGLIPFADDGGGNLTCFDYRENPDTDDPSIIFWCCCEADGENTHFVANNFEEFINMLHECEDDI